MNWFDQSLIKFDLNLLNCAFNDLRRHWQFDYFKKSAFCLFVRFWMTEATWPTGSTRSIQACSRSWKASWRKVSQASIGSSRTTNWAPARSGRPSLAHMSPTVLQVIPAVKGGQAMCSRYEREWLGDQAEIWQPLLLQGVHTGWVRNRFMCKQVNTQVHFRAAASLCQARFSGWREPLTSCLEESRRWCAVMVRSVGKRLLCFHMWDVENDDIWAASPFL